MVIFATVDVHLSERTADVATVFRRTAGRKGVFSTGPLEGGRKLRNDDFGFLLSAGKKMFGWLWRGCRKACL